MSDFEEYRARLQAEMAAAETPESRFAASLGPPARSRPRRGSTRIAAAPAVAEAADADMVDAALAIIGDPAATGERLSSALEFAALNADRRPDVFDHVLAVLHETSRSVEARRAALDTLQQLSFSMVGFPAKRPAFLAAMRALVDDPDANIRRRAIGILSQLGDEYVQRRLRDGLEHRAKALVPAAKAIQFLGYNVHGDNFPLMREIVADPPNQAARREAIRVLASDPSSVDLLAGILDDTSEKADVRRASAVALQALSPERFWPLARRIVLNPSEDDELRALAITALGYLGAADDDEEVAARVQQLGQEATSRHVKQAAKAYRARANRP